jgi:protein SCO1/2
MEPPAPDTPPPSRRTAVAICLVLMALGTVVWFNYYLKVRQDLMKGRLPKKQSVEKDPGFFIDAQGRERRLEEIKGKVIVLSYVYTTCPSGCAGVADAMKRLQDEFGSDPRFQLVSVSLYPENDRPELLRSWTETKGFSGDNWWFLTTKNGTPEEGDALRKWMMTTFKISVKRKSEDKIRENPADVWDHSLVMVMIDHRGAVRTPTDNDYFWYPFHPAFDDSWYPRPIAEDVRKVLDEAARGE